MFESVEKRDREEVIFHDPGNAGATGHKGYMYA
jgi:hypothetical protein